MNFRFSIEGILKVFFFGLLNSLNTESTSWICFHNYLFGRGKKFICIVVAFPFLQGESFYNPYIPDVIKELTKLGLVEESQGARVIFIEGSNIPLIVVKSDGGFNYASTDLTALWLVVICLFVYLIRSC